LLFFSQASWTRMLGATAKCTGYRAQCYKTFVIHNLWILVSKMFAHGKILQPRLINLCGESQKVCSEWRTWKRLHLVRLWPYSPTLLYRLEWFARDKNPNLSQTLFNYDSKAFIKLYPENLVCCPKNFTLKAQPIQPTSPNDNCLTFTDTHS
jgi:hypothetical protein